MRGHRREKDLYVARVISCKRTLLNKGGQDTGIVLNCLQEIVAGQTIKKVSKWDAMVPSSETL